MNIFLACFLAVVLGMEARALLRETLERVFGRIEQHRIARDLARDPRTFSGVDCMPPIEAYEAAFNMHTTPELEEILRVVNIQLNRRRAGQPSVTL